jgi:aryl-alcohol dehydrogenase-like predicted oxidoreductase
MRLRTLGQTGLQVGEISLGGLFTSKLGPGFEESRRAVYKALDLGMNYIDTAPGYADSEEVLGRILRDVKTPVILSTKLGGRPHPFDPQSKKQLLASFQESLRLLGRSTIDILFIHEPDRPQQFAWWTDAERVVGPVVEALADLKQKGDIRFTGLGGTTSTEMAHYLRQGNFDVVLTAFNYSPLFREAVNEVLPTAQEKQMGIVLGSVLQQGGLARRYDDVVKQKPIWLSHARQQQFLAFYQFLDEIGLPIVELGLRFGLSNPAIGTILIGPKNESQIAEAAAAVEKGPLPADILQRLDAIAAMVPFRPFEEPMVLPFNRPHDYTGPGCANTGQGVPVGKKL